MKFIAGHYWGQGDHWGFWFRILGYGMACSTMQPLFSERNGYKKCFCIFGVKFTILKKDDL